MKSNAQLEVDVACELEWDPSIDAANVGVAVRDGVVTLTGHLHTYAEQLAIEHAVQRVAGVQALVLELDVALDPGHERSDAEIAAAIGSVFAWHALVPSDRIHAKVEGGWVTLTGEVNWDYQRSSAEMAVCALTGVVGLSNRITLKPRVAPSNISHRIHSALARQAERQARLVEVIVNGTTVTLRGHVHSWAERVAAAGAAWSAPGISKVENEIKVMN